MGEKDRHLTFCLSLPCVKGGGCFSGGGIENKKPLDKTPDIIYNVNERRNSRERLTPRMVLKPSKVANLMGGFFMSYFSGGGIENKIFFKKAELF